MTKSVVGLDIGSASVRAVEVANPASARPTVLRRLEVALPDGAARSGEVIDGDLVATTLKSMWATSGFKTKKVVLGIGGQRVLAREVTVPRMPLRQIKQSLPYQVQDALPVPVAEMILDFYPTSEEAGENGPVVNGLVIAALRETVRANVAAVELAGLTTVEVDVVPFALSRALQRDIGSSGTVGVVDVGASATSVVVLADGVPQFVRIIRTGGDDLSSELIRRLQISPALAEEVKRTVRGNTASLPAELADAAEVVSEFETGLLASLRNTLAYYLRVHEGSAVERIVLTGGGSHLQGFEHSLSEVSGIPVLRGDAFAGIRRGREAKDAGDDSDALAVALGLALGSRS
ncbi:type IV pilus assembly protein PilM [uncultured Amnibacterium sp.]|uniref:type IV pilus assembly protein PilM n=1 Tax=uncultured Amnibacterium sp. TaxID=1631851 RepID=UPI0035CC8820